jgi:hypothetical protein
MNAMHLKTHEFGFDSDVRMTQNYNVSIASCNIGLLHKANVTVSKANLMWNIVIEMDNLRYFFNCYLRSLMLAVNDILKYDCSSYYRYLILQVQCNLKSSSRERQQCCHLHVRETSRIISLTRSALDQ